ncbi:basic proline-rich protein-like [Corapipo altera]|uniref:basic proline-rich protein-like n=1 Tax=Corapipo altera TaxID=415028 RepID=UPI000FD67AF0|nr:basic proline-rich protein-like [Corapipo altera]
MPSPIQQLSAAGAESFRYNQSWKLNFPFSPQYSLQPGTAACCVTNTPGQRWSPAGQPRAGSPHGRCSSPRPRRLQHHPPAATTRTLPPRRASGWGSVSPDWGEAKRGTSTGARTAPDASPDAAGSECSPPRHSPPRCRGRWQRSGDGASQATVGRVPAVSPGATPAVRCEGHRGEGDSEPGSGHKGGCEGSGGSGSAGTPGLQRAVPAPLPRGDAGAPSEGAAEAAQPARSRAAPGGVAAPGASPPLPEPPVAAGRCRDPRPSPAAPPSQSPALRRGPARPAQRDAVAEPPRPAVAACGSRRRPPRARLPRTRLPLPRAGGARRPPWGGGWGWGMGRSPPH